jgi:hypothetical protein
VLSDRDRTLLTPHLALLRTAQKQRAAAQQAFDEAERQLAESTTDTDWRDRRLGGLFSIDDGRTRRFRQARTDRKAAEKALAAAQATYTKYAERMDGLLEPMLTRDDPAYRTHLTAVRACDQALTACERLRHRLAAVLTKPARTARDAKAARGSEAWHEAELARQQFAELVTGLRTTVPALRRTIDRAALSLAEAAGTAPPDRPALDTTALDRLGSAAGLAAEQHLRGLQRQLDAAAETITGWRRRADETRLAALRAASDRLRPGPSGA